MARVGKKQSKINKKVNDLKNKKDRIKDVKIEKSGLLSRVGEYLGNFDYIVLIMVILISTFGILMVFSAGYYSTVATTSDALYFLKRQSIFVISGLVLLFITANFDYHRYNKFADALMIISIVLLVLVLLIGRSSNGATRWLGIGPIGITPSELSKLFMIIFTSVYLARDPEIIHTTKGVAVLLTVAAIHFGLIVKQPNLSTALVIVAIMIAIMFVAGLDWKVIAGMFAIGVAGTFAILTFMKDTHWYSRLTNWINPFADAQGEGYQVSQSIIALGNGGLKGLGFGNSIAKNLYLPEPQNDFILAIIGEELGFWGFALLMVAYMFLLYRLILIAMRAKDKLGCYLATGVAVLLGLQVIINVAVVTASMPATGITLPFVSYGGTSIWIFMAAMGIALNVSRKKRSLR